MGRRPNFKDSIAGGTGDIFEDVPSLGNLKQKINDPLNHPAHYTDGKYEVSDFIADKNLNFFLGNVVKYVCRAGKKDPKTHIQDLEKAAWYLNREIERLKSLPQTSTMPLEGL